MNIVHIEDEPWDSGLADYALTLAVEQARRGHSVSFLGRWGSPVVQAAKASGLKVGGWNSGASAFAGLPHFRRALRATAAEIIVAHTGSAHTLAVLASSPKMAVLRTRGDARTVKRNALTRWVAARTTRFVAASAVIGAQLRAAFPRAAVDVVAQGIEGPPELAPLPDMVSLGVLARLDPVKGHETILQATRRIVEQAPQLRVYCAGEGRLDEHLRARAAVLGVGAAVDFLGRVSDKWEFIRRCRIGVVASIGSEAVSRACLEWMAAGRPVVATRVGGIPELLEDGITGLLVPPGDSVRLAEAVLSLLRDPVRAQEMGRAARARWRQKYALEPFYENSNKVYEQAIRDISR